MVLLQTTTCTDARWDRSFKELENKKPPFLFLCLLLCSLSASTFLHWHQTPRCWAFQWELKTTYPPGDFQAYSISLRPLRNPAPWTDRLTRFSDSWAYRWSLFGYLSLTGWGFLVHPPFWHIAFWFCSSREKCLIQMLPGNWLTIQPAKAPYKVNGINSQKCDLNCKLLKF